MYFQKIINNEYGNAYTKMAEIYLFLHPCRPLIIITAIQAYLMRLYKLRLNMGNKLSVYGLSLLCAKIVLDQVCHLPSLLRAEFSLNPCPLIKTSAKNWFPLFIN